MKQFVFTWFQPTILFALLAFWYYAPSSTPPHRRTQQPRGAAKNRRGTNLDGLGGVIGARRGLGSTR